MKLLMINLILISSIHASAIEQGYYSCNVKSDQASGDDPNFSAPYYLQVFSDSFITFIPYYTYDGTKMTEMETWVFSPKDAPLQDHMITQEEKENLMVKRRSKLSRVSSHLVEYESEYTYENPNRVATEKTTFEKIDQDSFIIKTDIIDDYFSQTSEEICTRALFDRK